MSILEKKYFFVFIPKFLQAKGFLIEKKLPQYSLSAFIGNLKIDEVSILPNKQQRLYHTIFWLNSGKIQFELYKNISTDLVRIEVYDQGQPAGKLYISCKQYIKLFEQQNEEYHTEKVKISEVYDLQFDLFVGNSKTDIYNLLLEYQLQSNVRTPVTKQSNEYLQDVSQLNLDLLKIAESQIYQLNDSTIHGKNIFTKIDEQQSITSSIVHNAHLKQNNTMRFHIDIKQIRQQKQQIHEDNRDNKDNKNIDIKQKLNLLIFGLISLIMIYLSMFPIKRI